jgi:hypothetical protein
MTATLSKTDYSVSAFCPTCRVLTSFSQKDTVVVNGVHPFEGINFPRVLYVFGACTRCGRGGLATVPDGGSIQTARLESFFPFSIDHATLPTGVPTDVATEFREAERCLAFGAARAASALFRSVLEKVFKANGYTKGNDSSLRDLQKRIDAAAADGVITDARRKKAQEEVRCLGNDVLHDDWRAVAEDEVKDARHYTQRVLEDLYDDRPTVEAILVAKNRIPAR